MRATEFITELFQQSTVPWVWGPRSSDEAFVSFTVGQQNYRFYASNSPDDPEEWEIEFAATSKYSNGPSKDKLKYDYDLNGAGSGALVMSTVVSIMREFLKEYKHKISSIQFSAKEKSRQKLYTRMLQRLLPSWTFSRSIDSLSGSEKYLLTKPSDITEAINTDIMHRNFKHQQQIGDYTFKAKSVRFNRQKIVLLRISCYKGKEEIGYADFEIKGPGHGRGSESRLESDMTWVSKDHRQEGIASTMYAYAKMLGNDIAPSSIQLPSGKKMWDAWEKTGDAEHLMREARMAINQDAPDNLYDIQERLLGSRWKSLVQKVLTSLFQQKYPGIPLFFKKTEDGNLFATTDKAALADEDVGLYSNTNEFGALIMGPTAEYGVDNNLYVGMGFDSVKSGKYKGIIGDMLKTIVTPLAAKLKAKPAIIIVVEDQSAGAWEAIANKLGWTFISGEDDNLVQEAASTVEKPMTQCSSQDLQKFLGKGKTNALVKHPWFKRYSNYEHAFKHGVDRLGFTKVEVYPFFRSTNITAEGKLRPLIMLEFTFSYNGTKVVQAEEYYRDKEPNENEKRMGPSAGWKHIKTWANDQQNAVEKAWDKHWGDKLIKEATGNTITLQQLYGGNYPDRDETFWDYVNHGEFNIPLEIQTLPKHKVMIMLLGQYRAEHVDEITDMLDDDQQEIAQAYVNDPALSSKVIVVADNRIIDGNHRALAAAIRGVPINYVDLDELSQDDEEELTEYEHGTSNSKKIFAKLQSLGYEKLGSGQDSTVWAKDENHVIKILMPSRTIPGPAQDAERGFLTFYSFCKDRPELPNLPKFIDIGGEHHTVFELDGVPYRQIAMEKLQPIKNGSFEESMVWILSDLANIRAPWNNVVSMLKKPDTWGDDPKMSSMPELVTEKLADPAVYKQYGILYQTMSRLYHLGLKNGLGWDLHTENVMQRRDGTLVIVDPYFT